MTTVATTNSKEKERMTKHKVKLKQRNVVGGQNGYECMRCEQLLLAWSAKEANEMTMYPCIFIIQDEIDLANNKGESI